MNTLQAIIISIVEGITEFLPISSTGHMIITQELLGIESTEFVKAFTVNIQFGAILSVVVLYWRRFIPTLRTLGVDSSSQELSKSPLERFVKFYLKLLVAFLPAVEAATSTSAVVFNFVCPRVPSFVFAFILFVSEFIASIPLFIAPL